MIGTGLSYTWRQYLELTSGQREALITEANARHRR